MPESQELEGKFTCRKSDLEHLLTLERIAGFQLINQNERTQTDLYFDTADLSLRNQSCSLRMRNIGDRYRATFKGPRQAVENAADEAHLVARLEIEVEFAPDPGSAEAFLERLDLEPVRRAMALLGTGQKLAPIARLVTHRRMLHYERIPDEVVELSLDEVQAEDLRNMRRTQLVEVEVELVAGTSETLISAASSLQAAFPTLSPSVDSKLARTLDEPPGLERAAPASP